MDQIYQSVIILTKILESHLNFTHIAVTEFDFLPDLNISRT